ncbi:MAG: hypothetical protein P0Y64_01935 [Candidatus Sphingomonas colombiensis]|nr:hypothetical protein [Sphingomonas sp.]WEK43615.1 MAG: hypothetical protein P0Y64_01935 [Sphingomonas sp.]
MTFDPKFIFYRDDRALDLDPPEEFWSEIGPELRRLYESRLESFPDRVAKGRMARAEADRELRLARGLAEGWRALPRSPDAPLTTLVEDVHALRREITFRRQRWPRLVELRRITGEELDRRILLLELCHDIIWHGSQHPDIRAAREARQRHLQQQALKQAA